ncbi:MAG: OmpA family protein [Saprospiraceae bacterium]|nr:OmpA family protein [Saprospiraceae bacterium]
MITQRDDDYLICKEYQARIDQKSSEYPGFITFQHTNGNHYFAWVNGDEIIMRSEAYPDEERMVRGIKAILKNKDIPQRYKVEEAHGVYFLLLFGGGDHQEHTGNMESHNEIGRSCPKKSREEILAMLMFNGADFAKAAVPMAAAAAGLAAAVSLVEMPKAEAPKVEIPAAAAVPPPVAGAATTSAFNWKWLLPLLLLIPIFFWWKSCNNKKEEVPTAIVPANTPDTTTAVTTPATPPPAAPDCDLNWILFEFDKADITSTATSELTTMANILKKDGGYTALLVAHTDARGSNSYNDNLSQERAMAAKNSLVGMGIDAARITTRASSENQPIATNTEDDSGRHYNRRVELHVMDSSGKEICTSIPPSVPDDLKIK